jgi:hypothetical protein
LDPTTSRFLLLYLLRGPEEILVVELPLRLPHLLHLVHHPRIWIVGKDLLLEQEVLAVLDRLDLVFLGHEFRDRSCVSALDLPFQASRSHRGRSSEARVLATSIEIMMGFEIGRFRRDQRDARGGDGGREWAEWKAGRRRR